MTFLIFKKITRLILKKQNVSDLEVMAVISKLNAIGIWVDHPWGSLDGR